MLSLGVGNPLATIDTILKYGVHSVLVVQLRECQRYGMIKITHLETVALEEGAVGHLHTIQNSAGTDGRTASKEGYELQRIEARALLLHAAGREDG